MAAGLLVLVLAVLALLCVGALIALVVWLASRSRVAEARGDTGNRPAAPR